MENLSFKTVSNKNVICSGINYVLSYQNNYPERIKAVYIINCSTYFTMLFKIMKNFLSDSLIKKLHMYSDDSYKEELLKIIDADVLPSFLGGNRTDPDGNPSCSTFINRGKPILKNFYAQINKKILASKIGVKKIILTKGDFHEEILEINEPGSYLEWQFETKWRDTEFRVFYQKDTNGDLKRTELVPHQRIKTTSSAETGTYFCKEPGKYVLLFDNNNSSVWSKDVYYIIKVIPPQGQVFQLKEVNEPEA